MSGLTTDEFWSIVQFGMRFRVLEHTFMKYPFKTDEIITYVDHRIRSSAIGCNCEYDSCKGDGIFLKENGETDYMCMSWMNKKLGTKGFTYLVIEDFFDVDEFEI